VLETPAPGEPFDHGIFGLIEEPANAPWPAGDAHRFSAASIRWTPAAPAPAPVTLLPVLR
jgi:hypothetical protein